MVRGITVVLLFAVAGGGAFYGADLHRQHASLLSSRDDGAAAVAAMIATAGELAIAQQAYVAPGQPQQAWLARVTELVQQLSRSAAALAPNLRSSEATASLDTVTGAIQRFGAIDEQVRATLFNGQYLSAADLIFTEGRDATISMADGLRLIDRHEHEAFATARQRLEQHALTLIAAVAGVWGCGVLLLLRAPRASAVATPVSIAPAPEPMPAPADQIVPEDEMRPPVHTPAPPQPAGLDLAAAAAISVDLSRVQSADALPALLARAAAVLDAAGIIVWMAVDDELFAVASHGYDPRVMSRLGTIRRDADNATAAAWKSGERVTVPGDATSHGAIVTPMFSAHGCVGVVASEVRSGRESDAAACAVATILAAQLSSLFSAQAATDGATDGPAAESGSPSPLAASL